MPKLVRKINKAKWLQIDIETSKDVSADAITLCLKTNQNCLSVWRIETDRELENAVLAIVSAQDRLEAIDIVVLDESALLKSRIEIDISPGLTPVSDLVNHHRDLKNLTLSKLKEISTLIVEYLLFDESRDRTKCPNSKVRITKRQTLDIIKNGIDKKLLKTGDLKESVKEEVFKIFPHLRVE